MSFRSSDCPSLRDRQSRWDRGQRNAIALDSFKTGGLGRRFDRAISRADEDVAKFAVSQFLQGADASDKAAFMEGGWKRVKDRAIRSFGARHALKLPNSSEFGFAISTACMLSGKNSGEGSAEGGFVAKARALTAAVPFDAVPTYSDPDAFSRYFGAFEQALGVLEQKMKDAVLRDDSKELPESEFPSIESVSEPIGGKAASAFARDLNRAGGSNGRETHDSFGNFEI